MLTSNCSIKVIYIYSLLGKFLLQYFQINFLAEESNQVIQSMDEGKCVDKLA